jgi:uncharacterized membrane protein YtjA (UPF0391 family)
MPRTTSRTAVVRARTFAEVQIQNLFGRFFMLQYAAVFFVIALIAAVFGFTGIAVGAAEIAKVLFFIFLALFVISLLVGMFRRSP